MAAIFSGTAMPAYGRDERRCSSRLSACSRAVAIGSGPTAMRCRATVSRATRSSALESANAAAATFVLRPDASTLAVYPFQFELQARYELAGAMLSVSTQIRNRGDEDMPASFGYHPGFRWPLPYGEPRASHVLRFETDEPGNVRRIDSNGLLTPTRYPTPVTDRQLALSDALFRDDVLILDQIKSRSVVYGASTGPKLRIAFPDAVYLGLWTKPGAPFICIEPFGTASPDSSRLLPGTLGKKPGDFSCSNAAPR